MPCVIPSPSSARCGRNFPDIRTAAIEWQGRRLLVVGKQTDTEETEAIRSMARDLGMEDLVCLDALPLDRRHNAKIDYPALRGMLERRRGET